MKKKSGITLVVIVGVIILAIILMNRPKNNVPEEITKCIGENSKLYVQLGCHACKTQEEIFGEDYQYLDVIDCFYEKDKCADIQATPTWVINNEKITGVKTIEELKELTGC